jgi:uncharacterized protein (TIGR02118 family)
MIRLVSLLKRKPGTTHEEFLAYWRDHHGPLIRNSTAANYVSRYEQHPTAWPESGSGLPEPEFDGVTIQWFDSVEKFHAHMGEHDFPAMMEDIAKFMDTSHISFVLTEEPTVVIGD